MTNPKIQITKERPIIFSTEMVRAILEGRKTQTRRIKKGKFNYVDVECPYGKIGDRLWVRESFANTLLYDGNEKADYYYKADKSEGFHELRNRGQWKPSIYMPREASRITLEITNIRVERLQSIGEIDAKQEGVKVPVSPDGKYLVALTGKYPTCNYFKPEKKNYFQAEFASLWDSINAKKGFGWDKNPWVWVIEFTKIN